MSREYLKEAVWKKYAANVVKVCPSGHFFQCIRRNKYSVHTCYSLCDFESSFNRCLSFSVAAGDSLPGVDISIAQGWVCAVRIHANVFHMQVTWKLHPAQSPAASLLSVTKWQHVVQVHLINRMPGHRRALPLKQISLKMNVKQRGIMCHF